MIKQEIIAQCKVQVEEKLSRLKSSMRELQQANADNTKSTAGDKHETARAMVHLEQEKLGNQITIEEGILNDLNRMDDKEIEYAQFGTVVTTSKGTYLLGAACGKVAIDGEIVFGVSMQSPLAKALLKKQAEDAIVLNGNTFQIKHIS